MREIARPIKVSIYLWSNEEHSLHICNPIQGNVYGR